MSEKYSKWLAKLKEKYQAEKADLQEEEYRYLVNHYKFEGSTLLFILTIQFKVKDLTILIVNHNTSYDESCKYLGSISNLNNQIENNKINIILKIEENEELHSIKSELLSILENQLRKKVRPQGKGKFLGSGAIGRDSWVYIVFEGKFEDISIEDFFSGAINDAKKNYQMKKKFDEDTEKRSISIESIKPLNISNNKVKDFIDKVKNDLENIKKSMSDNLIKLFLDRSVIIENNALEKFGFFPDGSEACKVLGEIINIENLTIRADLDSRRFTIYIRGLYGYLIEEILQKYINNAVKIDNYIIKKINDFITSYKTKKIPYKIILPLNGVVADLEESNKQLRFPFSENAGFLLFDDVIIITKNSDLNVGRSVHYNRNDISKGIRRAISIYCKDILDFEFIEPNSFLFNFDFSEPESIDKSKAWSEIKNIFSSFILSNFKLGYGKQFYKFPWWMPKRRYQYDFPTPHWLRNIKYYNPSQNMSVDRMEPFQIKYLIPESYHNITFILPLDNKDMIKFTQGNISNGIGFFKIDQGRGHEMSFEERNLKIPSKDFQLFKLIFSMYSNKNSSINFCSNQFLINQLISLRLRENLEDAILDSCLIIESLLISGKMELSYQFKLHASLLISNNITEFKDNLGFFGDLYNLRSRIVHGDESWNEIYRKFLKNHTRWKFTELEWDSDKIEFTKSYSLNLIFRKILHVIMRINEIGLSLEEIKKPHNLIAKLNFNPLIINNGELNQKIIEYPEASQEDKSKKLLKRLKRIGTRINSILETERFEPPEFYINLKVAINELDKGDFEKFRTIFCDLNIMELKLKSKNQQVINGILTALRKIRKEICPKKSNSNNK